MAKILNLDQLSDQTSRELVLHGKTYKIKESTVEQFIESARLAQEVEAKDLGLGEQMEKTMELIVMSVPELSVAELKQLTLDQLQAIAAFVRGVDPNVIIAAISGVNEAGATQEGEAGKA